MKNVYLKGYSTLVTVILLLAFMSVVIVGINAIGISSLQSGYQSNVSQTRLLESESCIEEVLRRLKENPNYVGGTVPLSPSVSCTANVTGTEPQKTVTATMNQQNVQKTVTVNLNVIVDGSARNFQVTSWNEQ